MSVNDTQEYDARRTSEWFLDYLIVLRCSDCHGFSNGAGETSSLGVLLNEYAQGEPRRTSNHHDQPTDSGRPSRAFLDLLLVTRKPFCCQERYDEQVAKGTMYTGRGTQGIYNVSERYGTNARVPPIEAGNLLSRICLRSKFKPWDYATAMQRGQKAIESRPFTVAPPSLRPWGDGFSRGKSGMDGNSRDDKL